MKLSEIIIDYRTRMNISQREFSRRCGLSNSYISFIENEKNPRTGKPLIPTLEQYKKIATGMGMSLQKLFEMLDADAPVDISFPVSAPAAFSSDAVPASKDEIRILFPGASKLPPKRLELIKNSFLSMLKATNPELFEGDDDE